MAVEPFSFSEISDFINVAIATAKIEELLTPHYAIRPQLHLIQCGRIGSLKSTVINEVCRRMGIYPNLNLTSPVILGSVDKTTGVPTPPQIWESRNSILAIDEFHVGEKGEAVTALRTLLSVLENPEYNKPFAYRGNDMEKRDRGLYWIVKNNRISVKTRFVFFANTMMELHKRQRRPELRALKTRCVIIPTYPSLDEIKAVVRDGSPSYRYKDFKVKKRVEIPKKDFIVLSEMIDSYKIDTSYYARTLGDLCRIYAVTGMKNGQNMLEKLLKLREKEQI